MFIFSSWEGILLLIVKTTKTEITALCITLFDKPVLFLFSSLSVAVMPLPMGLSKGDL